jgi:hypothetical protein
MNVKCVSPVDDLFKMSKHVAPNTYTLSCVDWYYVNINLKHNGLSNLKIIPDVTHTTLRALVSSSHNCHYTDRLKLFLYLRFGSESLESYSGDTPKTESES